VAGLKRTPSWRLIDELFQNVESVNSIRVRRTNSGQIDYSFNGLKLSATGGIIVAWGSLPVGYRPNFAQYAGLQSTTGKLLDLTLNVGGGIVFSGGVIGETYRGNFTVFTNQAMPTTHPGIEVT
jgi:hypothetical protein